MKLLPFILLLTSLSASAQSNTSFKRVAQADIDQQRLEFAEKMAHKLLTAQRQGGYYQLENEQATDQMIAGLGEDMQRQSYTTIKSLFGDFEDMKFDHLMETTQGTTYEIYRFRGVFEKPAQIEIRTVLDAQGKLAGFYIKPWKDQL